MKPKYFSRIETNDKPTKNTTKTTKRHEPRKESVKLSNNLQKSDKGYALRKHVLGSNEWQLI